MKVQTHWLSPVFKGELEMVIWCQVEEELPGSLCWVFCTTGKSAQPAACQGRPVAPAQTPPPYWLHSVAAGFVLVSCHLRADEAPAEALWHEVTFVLTGEQAEEATKWSFEAGQGAERIPHVANVFAHD